MIRRWLRNWLGIQALDDQLNPLPKLVSREGKRIEPRLVIPPLPGEGTVVTTISVSAPVDEAPAIKKGYGDAPVR